MTRTQRWQVVRLADGTVNVRCTHQSHTIAAWCSARRNGFRPWWQLGDGPRHDIRQETRR
jgi:hypothetical protein